jgi:hypothetical protein
MKNNEISQIFNVDKSTLYYWSKDNKKGRKILYEVLKSLPIEFVEKIKNRIEEEEKLKESLKDEQK